MGSGFRVSGRSSVRIHVDDRLAERIVDLHVVIRGFGYRCNRPKWDRLGFFRSDLRRVEGAFRTGAGSIVPLSVTPFGKPSCSGS